MKYLSFLPIVVLALCLGACSSQTDDDDDVLYPSVISELVMAKADSQGNMVSFTTDAGKHYSVFNSYTGMTANSTQRYVCDYEILGEESAFVRSVQRAAVLHDFTGVKTIVREPTALLSAWLAGGFINMHLYPKTKGGTQRWGFLRDSTYNNPGGGITHCLSLYHDLFDDAPAYSAHLFACIALDSVAATHGPNDSVVVAMETYDGPLSRRFPFKK